MKTRTPPYRPSGPYGSYAARGVTLLEMAMVLLLLGVLATLGVSMSSGLIAARKVARTQAALEQAKACLVARAYRSELYPTYSAGLDCSAIQDPAKDVDACLCQPQALDGWSGRLLFLEGVRAPGLGLAGDFFAASAPHAQTRVSPNSNSRATDARGVQHAELAFALISFGADKVADSPSYARFAGGVLANRMDAAPDFSAARDDQALLVTADELAAALRQ